MMKHQLWTVRHQPCRSARAENRNSNEQSKTTFNESSADNGSLIALAEEEGIRESRTSTLPPRADRNWERDIMLAATNNTMQQLMQLLYLLGREPSVPATARHHVAQAQAELAMLALEIRNSAREALPADAAE